LWAHLGWLALTPLVVPGDKASVCGAVGKRVCAAETKTLQTKAFVRGLRELPAERGTYQRRCCNRIRPRKRGGY
jgi:hypothetical protein